MDEHQYRCDSCGRLLAKGSEKLVGTIRIKCRSCKNENTWKNGMIVRAPRIKMTDEELFNIIEERWELFWKQKVQLRAELAVGLRFKIFKRDNFICKYCGYGVEEGAILEVDHIIPRAKGGTNEEGNLITACWKCNRGKSDTPLDKMEESVLLSK